MTRPAESTTGARSGWCLVMLSSKIKITIKNVGRSLSVHVCTPISSHRPLPPPSPSSASSDPRLLSTTVLCQSTSPLLDVEVKTVDGIAVAVAVRVGRHHLFLH